MSYFSREWQSRAIHVMWIMMTWWSCTFSHLIYIQRWIKREMCVCMWIIIGHSLESYVFHFFFAIINFFVVHPTFLVLNCKFQNANIEWKWAEMEKLRHNSSISSKYVEFMMGCRTAFFSFLIFFFRSPT